MNSKFPPGVLALKLVLLAAGLSLAQTKSDASDVTLTLDDAVVRTLAYYPAIQASVAERDAAEASVEIASADRYPMVSLGASLYQYQKPMIVYPIHELSVGSFPPFDKTLIRAGADLRYNLYDGGARGARIDEATSRADVQASSLEATRQALTARVVSTYLEILARRQTLEAQDRSLETFRAELDRVRRLFDVGRAARIELLRVEATIARAEAERIATSSALDFAQTDLARLTGVAREKLDASNLVSVSLFGEAVQPRNELLEMAIQSNPSARKARQQIEVAEAAEGLADSDQYPQLDALAQYLYYGSAGSGSSLEWNVGVQVTYPLFTGGAVGGNRARALAQRRRADETFRQVESEIAQELDRSLLAIEDAKARIASLDAALESGEEVSRIERLQLEVGTGVQTDYLRAESDLLLTRANWIEARYAEIRARVELARVTGALDLDWLASHLRNEP
jgi:outer membrane protein